MCMAILRICMKYENYLLRCTLPLCAMQIKAQQRRTPAYSTCTHYAHVQNIRLTIFTGITGGCDFHYVRTSRSQAIHELAEAHV